jgi:hypothetical protein
LKISVITLEKAQALFIKLENNKDNPFAYDKDGCFARAHAINDSAFWTSHVANMVFVRS